MRADQLTPILQLYSEIIVASDASRIEAFASQFGKLGAQTLKKILNSKTIATAKSASERAEFAKDGVAQHIKTLALLLKVAGLKSAGELEELGRVIDNEFQGSSRAFLDAVTSPKPRASESQPIRLDIVRMYSEELARLENDNEGFDILIAQIRSDRKVRKQEIQEIATRFFGYRVTAAPKNKLVQKIVDLQAKNARQEARTIS
jgi:hypothetical protein